MVMVGVMIMMNIETGMRMWDSCFTEVPIMATEGNVTIFWQTR